MSDAVPEEQPRVPSLAELAHYTKIGRVAEKVPSKLAGIYEAARRALLGSNTPPGVEPVHIPAPASAPTPEPLPVLPSVDEMVLDHLELTKKSYIDPQAVQQVARDAAAAAVEKYQANVEEGSKWFGLKRHFVKPTKGVIEAAVGTAKNHPATQGVVKNLYADPNGPGQ